MIASRRALVVVGVLVGIALGLPWDGTVSTASAQSIQVISATPDTAEQGTFSLPVTIKGNGFKKGAKAKFFKTGTTDPAGITVTATKFVDSTQLVATIDVTGTAPVAGFDIVVANADGRTGKGTELFKVTEKIDPCIVPDPVPTRTASTSNVSGYPGFLDGRFGAGTGQVISPLGFRGFQRTGVAVQVVGGEPRIVAAGVLNDSYCTNDGQTTLKWAVVRYRPDGSRDTSFGNGGVVTTAFTGGSAYAADLAIDGLNRIVVVGAAPAKRGTGRIPTAVRYNENGSLDTTFGIGGVAAIPFGRAEGYANAVALQKADGKIVMVAVVSDLSHLSVIRLSANGALDSSFGGTGKFEYPDGDGESHGLNVTTQWIGTEERIVVAGRLTTTRFNTRWVGALWRFTPTGALDPDFGSGGVALTDFNPTGRYEDSATHSDVAVDDANRLVVAVNLSTWQADAGRSLDEVAIARFLATGSPDTSFGGGGMVVLPSSTSRSYGDALAVQRDGRIVMVGVTLPGIDNTDPSELAAWRVTGDGVLDFSFGNGGWISHPVTTEPRSAVSVYGVVEGPDGTFVAAGNAWFGDGWVPYGFLARIWQ